MQIYNYFFSWDASQLQGTVFFLPKNHTEAISFCLDILTREANIICWLACYTVRLACVASVPVRFKRKEFSRAKNGESAKNEKKFSFPPFPLPLASFFFFIFCALPIFARLKLVRYFRFA